MVLAALLAVWILALALMVLFTFFWVEMLVDAAKHKFPTANDKYIWIGVIALTGILGATAYYYQVKKK
jgi:hypothetical protein